MDRILDLFEKSTVTTFFITVAIFSTACYMWASGRVVPDILATAVWLVLGYFFGVKGQVALVLHFRKRAEKAEAQLAVR